MYAGSRPERLLYGLRQSRTVTRTWRASGSTVAAEMGGDSRHVKSQRVKKTPSFARAHRPSPRGDIERRGGIYFLAFCV